MILWLDTPMLTSTSKVAISLREMKAEATEIMRIAAFASPAFISRSEMATFEGGVNDRVATKADDHHEFILACLGPSRILGVRWLEKTAMSHELFDAK